MRKFLTAAAATLALGGVTLGAAAPAEARHHGAITVVTTAAIMAIITVMVVAAPLLRPVSWVSPQARRSRAASRVIIMTSPFITPPRPRLIIMTAPIAVPTGVGTAGRGVTFASVIATDRA